MKSEVRASNPKVSQILMNVTFAIGGIGYFIGFIKMSSGGAEAAVAPVAFFSVGIVGILSMIRHSIFNRSDAARMGWDLGRRNNFQLEVGFANLAIGLPALLAVIFDWDLIVPASLILAYALYFAQVCVLVLIDRTDGKINLSRLFLILLQTVFLTYFAISALLAIWKT